MRFERARSLLALLCLCAPGAAARALEVTATRPTAHAVGVARDGAVLVLFDRPVDPATLDGTSFAVFGRWTGPVAGSLEVSGDKVRFRPAAPLAAGDPVTVRLAPTLAGTDGSRLGAGYSWDFWTASAPAGMTFTEEGQLQPGNVPYGAHGGDLDHDGDVDLAVPNEGSNDMAVYLNDGAGGFGAPTSYGAGVTPSPIEAADLDGDHRVDLVVANLVSDDVSVYLGHGDGTFEPEVRYPAGNEPRGIDTSDLDRDGDLDLIVTNRSSGDLSLFRNRGDGSFEPEVRIPSPGSGETAVAAIDVTGDGLEDLVIGYHGSREVRVFARLPVGGFTALSQAAAGGQVWQMAVGDLNGDGLLDAVTANSSTSTAGVLLATAPGVLADAVTYPVGSFPLAIDLGDLDGDGDLDLVTSNFSGGTWSVYRNDGHGAFSGRQEISAVTAGSCAVLHDRDGDGDLDLTGIDELADRVLLLRND